MSYAAPPTLERDAIDRVGVGTEPDTADALLRAMAENLREFGRCQIECDRTDDDAAGSVARWLTSELCEPITVSRVDGGLLFTRESRPAN